MAAIVKKEPKPIFNVVTMERQQKLIKVYSTNIYFLNIYLLILF